MQIHRQFSISSVLISFMVQGGGSTCQTQVYTAPQYKEMKEVKRLDSDCINIYPINPLTNSMENVLNSVDIERS